MTPAESRALYRRLAAPFLDRHGEVRPVVGLLCCLWGLCACVALVGLNTPVKDDGAGWDFLPTVAVVLGSFPAIIWGVIVGYQVGRGIRAIFAAINRAVLRRRLARAAIYGPQDDLRIVASCQLPDRHA